MQRKFWLERWRRNEIGFHQTRYNPWLVKYWKTLGVPRGSTVFVPMCGKSLDMRWLTSQGYAVRGIEFAEVAIEAFFNEAGESFRRVPVDRLVRFEGPNAEIYCGDFFDLTAQHVAGAPAVFDRGALVALPRPLRSRYVDHLLRIVPDGAELLLVTLEYDQDLVAGPPYSVLPEEVTAHFELRCSVEPLESRATDLLPPKFAAAGVDRAMEAAYHIVKER